MLYCQSKSCTNFNFIDLCLSFMLSVLDTWLGIRNSIWPVKIWVMWCWHGYLSAARCRWSAYCSANATATASSFASLKSRMVYHSGAGLLRLSCKKGHYMGVQFVSLSLLWPLATNDFFTTTLKCLSPHFNDVATLHCWLGYIWHFIQFSCVNLVLQQSLISLNIITHML